MPFAFCLVAAAATNAATQATSRVASSPQFHDIKPPLEIGTIGTWLGRIAAAALLGALLWLGWWLWRRRKPGTALAHRIPPDERARTRLDAALALLDHPERFCTAVSEITRSYLEERFGLKAPDQTTEEFLADLPKNAELDERHKESLAGFLTGCDLVKFAKFEPARADLEALHAAALDLVMQTAPVSAPAAAAPPILPPSLPPVGKAP
ncbi:MAG: hypothetical protein WCP53_10225 [Verrucomicrobiota bacterium]